MTTRDTVLALTDLPRRKLHVPAWGGDVYVRMLTGTERDAFEVSCQEDALGLANLRARFVVLTACDADGKRVFEDGDATTLGQTAAATLDLVFTAGQQINGMRAEDIEDLAGN